MDGREAQLLACCKGGDVMDELWKVSEADRWNLAIMNEPWVSDRVIVDSETDRWNLAIMNEPWVSDQIETSRALLLESQAKEWGRLDEIESDVEAERAASGLCRDIAIDHRGGLVGYAYLAIVVAAAGAIMIMKKLFHG